MHSSFYFVACAGWPREGQAFHWRTLKSWQGWPSNDWCMLLLYFAFPVFVALLWHVCVYSVCLAAVARRHPNSWWWTFSSKWGLMFAIYCYVGFLKVKEKPHPYHLAPWFGVVILSHWLLLFSQTIEIWEHWLQRAFSLALKVVYELKRNTSHMEESKVFACLH